MKNLDKILSNYKNLPMDEFYKHVLYNKKYGYYFKKNPIGKKGDFVTSPGITFLFSEIIAIWIISLWESLNKPKNFNVIELGPGTGQMSKAMIYVFKKFPKFYESLNIFLYEKSLLLKSIQKKNVNDKKVKWVSNFKLINNGPVIFFGNEFFDSIPIKQFEKNNNKLFERRVEINNLSNYKISLKKITKKNQIQIKKYKTLRNANFIEFPKLGFEELSEVINKIKNLSGGIMLIDYGYIKQKNISTIQSVKSHKKNNLFENIGEADITSLVNFKLLAEHFTKNKLKVEKTVTQSFFLKRMGLIERAEIISKNMSFKDKSDLYFRIKRLLDQNLMGELFKVIFAGNIKKKKILGFS